MSRLLAPAFLFRFAVPCLQAEPKEWAARTGLDEKYRLPAFSTLDGKNSYADVRVAWAKEGLYFSASITGKHQAIWGRDGRIEDSDGVQLWIDTRDTKNVHRASRFCHRFAVMPIGSGRTLQEPRVALLAINRARESPREIDPRQIKAKSVIRKDGYDLLIFLPVETLTGYDPAEHNKIGFAYAVLDRELGLQTSTVGAEFPITEDPSVWSTLELVKS